jgi:hypothetical protein
VEPGFLETRLLLRHRVAIPDRGFSCVAAPGAVCPKYFSGKNPPQSGFHRNGEMLLIESALYYFLLSCVCLGGFGNRLLFPHFIAKSLRRGAPCGRTVTQQMDDLQNARSVCDGVLCCGCIPEEKLARLLAGSSGLRSIPVDV